MAATATRTPPAAARAKRRAATPLPGRSPAALALALGVAVTYATFARGASGIPEESRLQVGVAALAFATVAALLFARGTRVAPARGAVAGIALLAGFAAWSGLSIAWSLAPDESWLELNRALAYVLVACVGLAIGSSLPRAAERVALGYVAISGLVALYALGGKLFPWLHLGPLIDLNHTARFSRLRAPLEYWNALGMVCVLGVPLAMRAVSDLDLRPRVRMASLLALVALLTTLALTYSRGGVIAMVVAVAVLVAASRERARLLAGLGIGLLGGVPAVLTVVLRDDLKTDGLPASDRVDDGLILLVALLLGAALAVFLGRRLIRGGERVVLSSAARRRVRLGTIAAAVVVPLLVIGALAASDRGIGGTISHQAHEFTRTKLDRENDPARVLRTNSGNRWVWWKEAVGAFSDRPLVGYGAGSFPLVHRLYRKDTLEVRQPHSVPLEFLAETGLVGALLALGGLGLLGFAAVRVTRASAGRERRFRVALLAAAAAWGVHIWVDWDWDIPGVTLAVLALLGVLAARPSAAALSPPPPRGPGPLGRGAAVALGGAAAVVVIALAVLPAAAQSLASRALTQAAGGTQADLRRASETAALAKRLNPLAVDAVFAQASIAERGNQPAAAIGLLVEAVERQPNNPSAWFRLARLQFLVDDSKGALRSVATVVKLDAVQGVVGIFFAKGVAYDPARSASATGTPLPLLPRPAPAPQAPLQPPTPAAPAPLQPAPTPTPTPAPTPRAAPRPAPRRGAPRTPPPSGEPFRLEG